MTIKQQEHANLKVLHLKDGVEITQLVNNDDDENDAIWVERTSIPELVMALGGEQDKPFTTLMDFFTYLNKNSMIKNLYVFPDQLVRGYLHDKAQSSQREGE